MTDLAAKLGLEGAEQRLGGSGEALVKLGEEGGDSKANSLGLPEVIYSSKIFIIQLYN